MKRLFIAIFTALIFCYILTSCGSETHDDLKSSECDILHFIDESNFVNWTITGDNITVVYPAGTDLSSISPQIIISEKAEVNPQSGSESDFSNEKEVTYAVTAEDGTVKMYKAQAKELVSVKNSECDILEFIDEDNLVNWEINGTNITAVYSAGIDLSSIKPIIAVSGKATVNPQSGSESDFSNEKEVIYTVTAEDGTVKIYMVRCCQCNNEDNDLNSITPRFCAKVESASKYDNITEVRLMGYDRSTGKNVEFARGNWKNGGFTIELPETLAPDYLYSFIDNNGILDVPATLSISNKNVKLTTTEFLGDDKNGKTITQFFPFKIEEDRANYAFLTFVDSDVTISGYIEGSVAISEFDEEKDANIWYIWQKNTFYSIEWKKGWNVWYLSSSISSAERIKTEQWTTSSVSELKWYGVCDLWKININYY